jgi:glycosyltransferase involved in cell wall biosynthesis
MNCFAAPGTIRQVAILGTHVPRQCGIATFTADLRTAIAGRYPQLDCFVVAVNDPRQAYAYPDCVRMEIRQEDPSSYRRAAAVLDQRGLDVLCVQHEYGIFGGMAGARLLDLMREVHMPVVTTLHTILAQPDARQRTVMDEVLRLSERVVVMSAYGAALLRQVHGTAERKIDLIPHGIPQVPFHSLTKGWLGLGGRRVLLTFGLLAPDKGIEYVIEAMPAILRAFPETVYVVLGASHPHVRARMGESYRAMLEDQARHLGVADSVRFLNRFVSLEELTRFLAAADIYLTPYLKTEQITSGTLAYALGTGKVVISTPYHYAKELLADGRGLLVPCRDAGAIARGVVELLGDDARRLAMRRKAAEFGRGMAWPVVAAGYLESFSRACRDRDIRLAPGSRPWPRKEGDIERVINAKT